MTKEQPTEDVQHSSADDNRWAELSALKLDDEESDFYFEVCAMFDELGIDGYIHDVPLEALQVIAQVFADASGFDVVLQAEILEPIADKPDSFRKTGLRDVFRAEPRVFFREV